MQQVVAILEGDGYTTDAMQLPVFFQIPWGHHVLIIDKDNIKAQYALEASGQPLGISEYKLSKLLPTEFRGTLPTIEELERELEQNEKELKY